MTWVLRILLVVLVVRALWRLMKGVFEGAGYTPPDMKAPRPVTLVRDPVCGVYVSTVGRTLVAHAHGQTAYFCSERCREQWEGREVTKCASAQVRGLLSRYE